VNKQSNKKSQIFPVRRRIPIRMSSGEEVNIQTPTDGTALPIIIRPEIRGINLCGWATLARGQIDALLLQHGAILFRGFDVTSGEEFKRFIEGVSDRPLPYLERSSPRTLVEGNIYTSTEYPPEHSIFLHCENSYQKAWPLKIFFYCHVQPEQGGETPIADTRRVLTRIDPDMRAAFASKGVLYQRNFGSGLGLSWQTVFQTHDREQVERYCNDAGIECIWRGPNGLTTRSVRKAIRQHPVTGEDLWFNHAVFFHISTLDPETQRVFHSDFSDDELPNNTYYGDGATIETEVYNHLRNAYAQETVKFPWQAGDVLMLDNMLVAHGRTPYKGARKILVGMTELHCE
jgi:alpha-ketoglutarate-dependent taurine dioxygenase